MLFVTHGMVSPLQGEGGSYSSPLNSRIQITQTTSTFDGNLVNASDVMCVFKTVYQYVTGY